MQLSIVGSLPEQTSNWIEEYFGHWKKPDIPLENEPDFDINLGQVKGKVVDTQGPWPASLLFWNTVGHDHPDAAAIQLLQEHLFEDKASLFSAANQYDPDFMLYFPLAQALASHGVAGLALSPRARTSLDVLIAEVHKLTKSVKSNGISEQRLCYLKQVYLNERLEKLTDNLSLAKMLSATSKQDFQHPITAPWERINAVSVDDIKRVANKYFRAEHQIRLDLLPPWYIRWTKQLLEWLPKDTADSLEEEAL
ncbi:MAG: insulinase family protein [Shewanella sp.]|nr:insulinase family protein [Shewanella sp.]